jgi:hypothetical protein
MATVAEMNELIWLSNMTMGAFDRMMAKLPKKDRVLYTFRAPQATQWMNVDELVRQGMIGVYARR